MYVTHPRSLKGLYKLGKSSNRSGENFNILAKKAISRKSLFFEERYFILEVIYYIFILIDQLPQFPSREKDGYPNSVKSHVIIQFLELEKMTETLEKNV